VSPLATVAVLLSTWKASVGGVGLAPGAAAAKALRLLVAEGRILGVRGWAYLVTGARGMGRDRAQW
jgi:hypothetical protein